MKLNQIITSLLETDMYKFSMGEAIYHQFSDYKTTWTFKCRNTDVHFTAEMVQEIKEQIKAYCSLRFTEEELEYLNRITWIKGSYIDFLRLWQPRYEDFKISDEAECGLSIETFGTWLNTSLYEIPTLAIVNEVYFRRGTGACCPQAERSRISRVRICRNVQRLSGKKIQSDTGRNHGT